MTPKLRAVLIAAAVFTSVAEGCPLVPNIQPRHLEGPIGARELARWGERLRGLGAELSDRELAEKTLAFSASAREVHGSLLRPVLPAFSLLQLHQKWSLFPIADPSPWWFHVEGREGTTWRVLYRPLGEEDSLSSDLRARLEYRRLRAQWNPGTSGPRPDYERFVDWLSARVFEERPELDAVRVRYLRFDVPALDGSQSDAQSWHFPSVRTR